MAANKSLKLAFVLSATDKMSRVIDEAVKKSTDKLSSIERTTGRVSRSMTKAGAWLVGAGAAIGAAGFGMAKSAADYGEEMLRTSQRVGIGLDQYQKLSYAARMNGVEHNQLTTIMEGFNKKIVEAGRGNKTALQTFNDLGVKIRDARGNIRASNEIFGDFADIFAGIEDGATKTALTVELFGGSGAQLIPMLNMGRAGLKDFGDEAERMGLVLDQSAIEAGDRFNKNLNTLTSSAQGLGRNIGATLLPTFDAFVSKATDIIGRVMAWIDKNPDLVNSIGDVALKLSALLITVGTGSMLIGGLTFVVGKMVGAWRTAVSIFRGAQYAFGFLQVAIAGVRGTTVAANSATRAYMIMQGKATAATKAYTIGQKLAAGATKIFNAVLKANPIIRVISLIIALGTAVYHVIKNWDTISAFFANLWEKVKAIFGKALEWIKNIWGSVTGWFSNLWGGIKNAAGKAWDGISSIAKKSRDGVQGVWGSIAGWFSNLWDKVKDNTRKGWEVIKTLFLNFTPYGLVIKHWDVIADWFTNLWGKVKDSVVSAWDSIGDYFGDLGKRFFEWGQNLINSLWNGIKSIASKAIDGIRNVGSRIANGFKSVLGINSPSRLFMDYGVNITQGLIGGIETGESSVERASEGLALQTTKGIANNINSNTVDSSVISNSVGGFSLNYAPNITINGQVTSETKEDFAKMLRKHKDEIIDILNREKHNNTRLSFG